MDPSPPAVSNETAALVALLRAPVQPHVALADQLEESGSAQRLLEEATGLLAGQLLADAAADINRWIEHGIRVITLLDPDYPANLRAVYDRPPVLFIRGRLRPRDIRAVAVIGSRRASAAGLARARAFSDQLVKAGYTIVSGLAAGIDTAAHRVALEQEARTIAVIGTGLEHAYPPQNLALQQTIAVKGAVISQFSPEVGPDRRNFPLRNAVMSGVALATFLVEATHKSGARTQVRAALAHGRPVLLAHALLNQRWARELADRPGVHVIRSQSELSEVLARLSDADALVA
jgi:DNA processing protein